MKNIVAYDVETTGLDPVKDSIIQLAAVKFDLDFNIIDSYSCYVKPETDFEIAEDALEKHGLTKDFILENGIPSNEVMKKFNEFCKDCDILSYNGNSFDIKFITKEMRAAGLEFSLDRVFYDALKYETFLFPRRLDSTYTKYTGKILENAHDAFADVKATIEIFKYQLAEFEERNFDMDKLMALDESKIFCVDGMIKKEGDQLLFAKGKHRDMEIMCVCKNDPGYIKWFMNNLDFDPHTKKIIKEYYWNHKNSSQI